MKWAIGVVGLVVAAAIVAVWQLSPLAKVGSAYSAKAVCSGVFVAGMDADRVFAEEVEPIDSAMGLVGYQVDEDEKSVRASIYGLGASTAVYRPETGCTLLAGGEPDPISSVGNAQSFQPLPTMPAPPAAAADLDAAIDDAFEGPINGGSAQTRAIVVVHDGQVIAERYADGVDQQTALKGWSMNKTLTGLVIGMLVDRGWLDLDAPAPVEEWSSADDPRAQITLRHLMTMTSGLGFDESYGDLQSDVVQMLFTERSAAARAADAELAHEPGAHWSYSSGTSNILARIARNTLDQHGRSWAEFMQSELFAPIGVSTAVMEADSAGDFVGSSFGYMSAQDWARIGMLLNNEGRAPDGRQVVPADWIAFMATDNGRSEGQYGAQLWLNRSNPAGDGPPMDGVPADALFLSGHDGQLVAAIPSAGVVVVRLGETSTWSREAGVGDVLRAALNAANMVGQEGLEPPTRPL